MGFGLNLTALLNGQGGYRSHRMAKECGLGADNRDAAAKALSLQSPSERRRCIRQVLACDLERNCGGQHRTDARSQSTG